MTKVNVANNQNIILTGIPRSGTTLLCRLLSECNNVVALNEPLSADVFPDRRTALANIASSFTSFRSSLLHYGTAPARVENGTITDNAYSEIKGLRTRVVDRMDIHFDKPLSSEFQLALKHCAEFTLLLPELADQYQVFALVRNPLALLSSWATVNVPVSRGKVAKSTRLLPAFAEAIEAIPTLLEKQLFILDWYFKQYTTLPEQHVLRYEEVVSGNGSILGQITDCEVPVWSLKDRNTSSLYETGRIKQLTQALITRGGAWNSYYSNESILTLSQDMLKQS
ncbi:MAG: hypothetical protein KA479_06315 [Saprospiraceae bacterium]|nr:hypothetical protein [Saprospiraceae bacterium]